MEEVSYEGLTWVSIQEPSQQEIDILGRRYNFHQLDLEDCLSKSHLNKIDEYIEYIFMMLHLPYPREGNCGFTSNQLSVFLGKDYLITVHQGSLKQVASIFERCKGDEVQRKIFLGRSPAFLLYRILDRLVDDILPLVERILEELDTIEDKVFDPSVDAASEVAMIRRKIADLRRSVTPLRHVIEEISAKAQKRSGEDLSAYFGDVMDHLGRVHEALEEAKETIEIYKDTDFLLNTEKTNRILAILTIAFTLSIPATVIGTFYGMNIHLPGGITTGAWNFMGQYTTFIIFTIASVVPASIMIWYFRQVHWI